MPNPVPRDLPAPHPGWGRGPSRPFIWGTGHALSLSGWLQEPLTLLEPCPGGRGILWGVVGGILGPCCHSSAPRGLMDVPPSY